MKSIETDIEFIAAALTQRSVSVSLKSDPNVLIIKKAVVEKITPNVIKVRRPDGVTSIILRSAVQVRG